MVALSRKATGPRRVQTSRTQTTPAPVGGLNAVDALAAMPPTDAIIMDNWFPQPSYVSLRNGYTPWSTGYTHWVDTILTYSNATADKIFGMSGTSVYDATAGGAIGAAVVTGLTNSRWEYTNVATAGGQFLYAGNGVDKPLLYDGTAWVKVDGGTTPAITGVTTTKLRNPIVWKNRVWWVEEGSMRAWYLPTASVGGAAQSIDFGPIFRLGGELHVIMTASLTDGSTFDDYIMFVSTEGEIALYRGTDPANAATFILSGMYQVGKPVGRRCFFKYGEDAVIICSDGFVSMTKTISIGRVNATEAISYKILNLVNQDVQAYRNNFGWQGAVHPLGNKLIVNVPQVTDTLQYQYVMNTITNSWCRFTNWNAATFEVQGDTLYFGSSTFIAKADVGTDDNLAVIPGLMKTAFQYLGSDRQKYMKMARPLIQTDGTIQPALAINVDYQDAPPTTAGTYISTLGSPWDTSPWDTSSWTQSSVVQTAWVTVNGIGFAIALYVSVSAKGIIVRLQAIDYVFEDGAIL